MSLKKLPALLVLICAAQGAQAFDFGVLLTGPSVGISPVKLTGPASDFTIPTGLNNKLTFDARYAQVSLGYLLESGTSKPSPTSTDTRYFSVNLTYLTMEAFLKLPIILGRFSIYPMIGAEYRLNLVYEDDAGKNDLKNGINVSPGSDLNELWLKAGAGVDFTIYEGFFVRLDGLFAVNPENLRGNKSFTSFAAPGSGAITVTFSGWAVDVELLFGWKFY